MDQLVRRPFLTEQSIEDALIAAVERASLQDHPFDYVRMEEVLDSETYAALLAAIPDRRFYHHLKHWDAIRADGSSTRLRMYLCPELLWRLPVEQRRVWDPIARALWSKRLQDAFKRKFREALEQRFGKPVERIGLYPVPILLRDQPGYRIGIHADAEFKAITVQFYLPSDESQRHLGTIFHEGESGEAAERTIRMPFLPRSGYAFPVTLQKSWHSAAKTSPHDGERLSMMITYYVADDVFTRLKWRLRRIGFSFGLRPRR